MTQRHTRACSCDPGCYPWWQARRAGDVRRCRPLRTAWWPRARAHARPWALCPVGHVTARRCQAVSTRPTLQVTRHWRPNPCIDGTRPLQAVPCAVPRAPGRNAGGAGRRGNAGAENAERGARCVVSTTGAETTSCTGGDGTSSHQQWRGYPMTPPTVAGQSHRPRHTRARNLRSGHTKARWQRPGNGNGCTRVTGRPASLPTPLGAEGTQQANTNVAQLPPVLTASQVVTKLRGSDSGATHRRGSRPAWPQQRQHACQGASRLRGLVQGGAAYPHAVSTVWRRPMPRGGNWTTLKCPWVRVALSAARAEQHSKLRINNIFYFFQRQKKSPRAELIFASLCSAHGHAEVLAFAVPTQHRQHRQ